MTVSLRSATLASLGIAALGFLGPRVAPSPTGPEDAEVAARIGPDVIGMEAYEHFLRRVSGRRPLETLIDRLLVRREHERLGLALDEAELDAYVQGVWDSYLTRFGGHEAGFVTELDRSGFTKEEYLANLRDEARHELRAQAIVRAARVVTEEDVLRRFEERYGEDGVRVEVRHVFLAPARMRADKLAEGVPREELGPAQLDALCLEVLADVLDRLDAGEDFADLAARFSHDVAARTSGGKLPNYNYRAYGPEFSEAVRAAEVGVTVGPVRTDSGFHLIQVTDRARTELAAVEAELRSELETEDATPTELRALIDRLRAAVEIETY